MAAVGPDGVTWLRNKQTIGPKTIVLYPDRMLAEALSTTAEPQPFLGAVSRDLIALLEHYRSKEVCELPIQKQNEPL